MFRIQKKSILWRLISGIMLALLIIAIFSSCVAISYQNAINDYFGLTTSTSSGNEGETIYEKGYETLQDLIDAKKDLIREVSGEGVVLLKNDGVLPLQKNSKVSCFGRTTVDPIYGGTGSGSSDTSISVSLVDALSGVYSVNNALIDFYSQFKVNRNGASVIVGEVSIDNYTADVRSSYTQYHDAAIVTIGRIGGEGHDLPQDDYADGNKYLALNDDEKAMLTEIRDNFDTIIVLLNTTNMLELGWLDEYCVDACLWVGSFGLTGTLGVADVLTGEVNPSGRLVDTIAVDSFSSPAIVNSGVNTFTNASAAEKATGFTGFTNYYYVEKEGIYIGYRYYETRYEDCVIGGRGAESEVGTFASTGGWNYSEEVAFPFGFGLSYTEFTQTIGEVTFDSTTATIPVTVKNTGSLPGKEVVQLYVQTPYTDKDIQNKVEKSAVQLVGFGKTEILQPNDETTVVITVDKADFASYDYTSAKTYILDAGDYYFAVGESAHEALNNVLAAKGYTEADGMDTAGDENKTFHWEEDEPDTETFAMSKTGTQITNVFDDADLNYYGEKVTYLSRNNWSETWPTASEGIAATQDMIDQFMPNAGYTPGSSDTSSITTGADNGLMLFDMLGLDYDDEKWDLLLDQLTTNEMAKMIGMTSGTIAVVTSVNSPEFKSYDGPGGVSAYYTETRDAEKYPRRIGAGGFNSAVVLAATWNTELMERTGVMKGEEGLWTNISGLYGPAANLHRTPYSGRNFEYYSEDPFISGKTGACEVRGIQSRGLITYVKHFAVNDQETEREGCSTFANEQALRETSLKAFQDIVEEGKPLAIMNALNRVGCKWTGHSSALLTSVLRNEWGFAGFVDTDMAISNPYMTYKNALEAGNDSWLSSSSLTITDALAADLKTDVKLLGYARESVHRILYAIVNSNAMNGASEDTVYTNVQASWIKGIYAGVSVFGVLTLAAVVMLVLVELNVIRRRNYVA